MYNIYSGSMISSVDSSGTVSVYMYGRSYSYR